MYILLLINVERDLANMHCSLKRGLASGGINKLFLPQ